MYENQNGAPITQNEQQVPQRQIEHVPFSQWCVLLTPLIPFVGSIIFLVIMIMWAIEDVNTAKYPCRVNYARVALIMMAIAMVLFIILFVFCMVAGFLAGAANGQF